MIYNLRLTISIITLSIVMVGCMSNKQASKEPIQISVLTEKQRIAFEEELIDANKEKMLGSLDAAQKGFLK